jgi:hypothetical protein
LLRLLTLAFPILLFPIASVCPQTPANLVKSPGLSAIDPGHWRPIQNGIEFRKLTLERSEPRYLIDLKILRFDARWLTPRLVFSTTFQMTGANVKTLVEKSGAIAAINANYFDERGRPLGFLKTATREINRSLSRSSLFTGVFGVKEFTAFIQHRDEFNSAQADEALQAGPLLLLRGTALDVTRGQGRNSRRSVVGIDKQQRLIIAITDALLGGLSWVELQELFSARHWQIETVDLLNLDGGGSAQLYIKTANINEHVAGTTDIPVAIGLFKKAN